MSLSRNKLSINDTELFEGLYSVRCLAKWYVVNLKIMMATIMLAALGCSSGGSDSSNQDDNTPDNDVTIQNVVTMVRLSGSIPRSFNADRRVDLINALSKTVIGQAVISNDGRGNTWEIEVDLTNQPIESIYELHYVVGNNERPESIQEVVITRSQPKRDLRQQQLTQNTVNQSELSGISIDYIP